jgi:hypothetical protein
MMRPAGARYGSIFTLGGGNGVGVGEGDGDAEGCGDGDGDCCWKANSVTVRREFASGLPTGCLKLVSASAGKQINE